MFNKWQISSIHCNHSKGFQKNKNINIEPVSEIRDIIIPETNTTVPLLEHTGIIREKENSKCSISLFDFTNDQKFYLKSHKRYTVTNLYNEWIRIQNSVYKNITKCNTIYLGQFMKLDKNSNAFT